MSLKVKIDNIEKYATALNNLIGADSAYFTGDENVDNLVELINIVNQQQAEIERLKDKYEVVYQPIAMVKTEAKVEAVKEFAEILKEFMHTKFKDLDAYEFEYVTENDIDNLVKERKGEE